MASGRPPGKHWETEPEADRADARGQGSPAGGGVLGAVLVVACMLTLAATLVFAGFMACRLPVTTSALSQMTSDAENSPYTLEELRGLAIATADYAFGGHDGVALASAEVEALGSALRDGRAMGLSSADLDRIVNAAAADGRDVVPTDLAGLPDTLVLPTDALSHLDDCHRVASLATAVLAPVAVLALVLVALVGKARGPRSLGGVLIAAPGLVAAILAVAGAWAVVDFHGFFATFHRFFFAQGTWSFPWESLLIRMYPDDFWMGMGLVWLVTTGLLGALCVVAGLVLRVRSGRSH